MFKSILVVMGIVVFAFADGPALKTAQTESYNEYGNTISDGSVKDDGFYQAGISREWTYNEVTNIITAHSTGLQWFGSTIEKEWLTDENYNSGNYNDTSGDTATTYCDGLIVDGLNDWRLPSINELITLDSNISGYVNLFGYWSSSTDVSDSSKVWILDTDGGYMVNNRSKSYDTGSNVIYEMKVACVRDEFPVSSTLSRSNEIVTDHTTGLQWQDDANTKTVVRDWIGSIDYCEELTLGGFLDWRLPNKNELYSIVDYNSFDPAIDTSVFVNGFSNAFWSSTTDEHGHINAYGVGYIYGTSGTVHKSNTFSVRCVRLGSVKQLPVANAGPDINTTFGQYVTLSASNSSDADGSIVSYEWKEGNTILSSYKSFSKSDFSEGLHTITLSVTDNDGASASDEVLIRISPLEDWLIYGLSDSYDVGDNRFFVKEFTIYANWGDDHYLTFDELKEEYDPNKLDVQLNDNTLSLECIPEIHAIHTGALWGGAVANSYIQKNCKIHGTLNTSYNTSLLVDFPDHSFHKTVDIAFNISDHYLSNINDEEAFIILNGDLVTRHAVISFNAGPEDITEPPTCVHKDKDGNDIFMNVQQLGNSRYRCSTEGNIDEETINRIAQDKQINVKILFGSKAKIVEVPVYIRTEKKATAMLEYVKEYEYMQSCSNAVKVVSINDERYLDIHDKKFYLGGDITNSENDYDDVRISGGIWKLHTAGHELLLNIDCSSLDFEVKRNILYNPDILEFRVKAESKFDVIVKKAKIQSALFLEGIKYSIINFNSEESAFHQTFADTTAAIRGTTFQVSKEANQSVSFNLLEGEIEIESESLEHNITLNNMTSWKSDESTKKEIRNNTLDRVAKTYLKDTSINSVDANQSIGEITIHTNIDQGTYYLLGKNVQYSYGKNTIFEEVAEGNYTVKFLPVSGYFTPDDVGMILSSSNLFLTMDVEYKGITDFGNTYHNDLLWHQSKTGAIKVMAMNGLNVLEEITAVEGSNTNLLPKGIGDFTGDNKPDILFHNQNSGNLRIWEMDGTVKETNIQVLGSSNTNLKIAGVGDFDSDGDMDIATFNTNSGALRIWVMEGTTRVDNIQVLSGANPNLVPRGAGDMDGDGISDIVLRNNNSGAVRVWTMNNNFTRKGNEYVTGSSNTNLELRGVVDIDGDGNFDILNYNTNTGRLRAWLMDGSMGILENAEVIQDADLDWSVRN